MIDIIQGFQRINDFRMRFIFLQHLTADRNGYGINGKAAAHISRVLLYFIYCQAEPADYSDKVLQADTACQFKMHFEMVGPVVKSNLQRREPEKDTQQGRKSGNSDRVASDTEGDADDDGHPQPNGCGEPFNLAF